MPYSMRLEICNAANCENVKGATHANSIYMNLDDYWNHIFKFINIKISITR